VTRILGRGGSGGTSGELDVVVAVDARRRGLLVRKASGGKGWGWWDGSEGERRKERRMGAHGRREEEAIG